MDDSFLDGKVQTRSEGGGHSLAHAMGRIEGILEGIREDMKAAADAQQALLVKLEATNTRVEALETWREILARYERDRQKRARVAGVVGLALLVPAIEWGSSGVRWIYYSFIHRPMPGEHRPPPAQRTTRP
jgi:hypothetical protein